MPPSPPLSPEFEEDGSSPGPITQESALETELPPPDLMEHHQAALRRIAELEAKELQANKQAEAEARNKAAAAQAQLESFRFAIGVCASIIGAIIVIVVCFVAYFTLPQPPAEGAFLDFPPGPGPWPGEITGLDPVELYKVVWITELCTRATVAISALFFGYQVIRFGERLMLPFNIDDKKIPLLLGVLSPHKVLYEQGETSFKKMTEALKEVRSELMPIIEAIASVAGGGKKSD